MEGTIQPHPASIEPLKKITAYLKEKNYINRVLVCGSINQSLREELEVLEGFIIKGSVKRDEIPEVLQGNLYMALEINPPCPNSVIEAMASGCPVIGFNSGSLKNLVKGGAGIIAEYGGDPWKMDIPAAENLTDKLDELMKNFRHLFTFCQKMR